MRMARRVTVGCCSLAALLVLVGCGPNPKDLQIQSLNEQLGDCQRENDDLRARLATASRDRDSAMARARSLQDQLADLRSQMAERGPERARAEGWTRAGEWEWIDLGTDFLFDSGRATLKSGAQEKIQQVVSQIKQYYPERMILVVGHTDTDPIVKTKNLWQDNLDLSANRAMTVYRALNKAGLNPEYMVAGGQGEYNPVAPNTTDQGKAQNRRVQIAAIPRASAGTEVITPGVGTGAPAGPATPAAPPTRPVPTEK